ncbi:MAG: AEC family transporter [Bacillota bacterium]
MEELIFTAQIVLPLFFLILVGAFCAKKQIVSEEFLKGGNKLSFTVLLPVMLFMNIYNGRDVADFNIVFALQIFAAITVAFLGLWFVLRFVYKDIGKLSVMIQAGFRSNFVLFGTYLMSSLYGDTGVAMVSCYLALVVSTFNVYATFILEFYSQTGKTAGAKGILIKILKNPLIIASLLGLAVNLIGIELGTVLETTLKNISSIATIFAMICLGGNLKIDKIKADKWNIALGTILRLIIVPGISCSVFYFLGYRAEMFAIILIVFATPVAVSSYIMAQEQGADSELAGGIVASTTLFSTLSLFVLIYVAKVLMIF